jgi:hypothetical protein
MSRSGCSKSYTLNERLSIQPNVGFYNLFNFANLDLPGAKPERIVDGSCRQINGTTRAGRRIILLAQGQRLFPIELD